jgi:lysophospholipase L1-like esterase
MRTRNWLLPLVATGVLASAGLAFAGPPAPPGPTPSSWVGSWSVALTPPNTSGTSATGFTDQTLREIVHTSLGGTQLRLRLSNAFGSQPLVLDSVGVGLRGSGASLVPGSGRAVSFDGAAQVVIPVGAETFSDPIDLPVDAGQDLAVSLYTHGATGPTSWHPTASTTSYYATGQHTADATGTAFTGTTTSWYLLDGVDVRTRAAGAVVALGDSITDGTNSTPDADRSWPEDLARRLAALPQPRRLSVLDEGISGNRVLTDAGSSGVSAQARFDRDVLAQTGVRTVIFLEGINDIGHDLGPVPGQPATPADVIAGLTAIIRAAHEHGLRIIGTTLTTIGGSKYDTPQAEATRQAVNSWIRTSGAYDEVVDFDAVTRDPQDPTRYLPAFDSGDHLHPDDAGYQAMADAINLSQLEN